MLTPALSGSPFFARIRNVELACPRCDTVHVLHWKTGRAIWNPSTGQFCCASCKLSLQLGITAYPIGRRSKYPLPPDDTIPSPAQSAQIRTRIDSSLAPLQAHQAAKATKTAALAAAKDRALRAGLLERGMDGGGGLLQPSIPRKENGDPVNVVAAGECRCQVRVDEGDVLVDPRCPAHGSGSG